MTIDEAIKILRIFFDHTSYTHPITFENAVQLGIEALIRIKNIRVIELDPELHHLPSEERSDLMA